MKTVANTKQLMTGTNSHFIYLIKNLWCKGGMSYTTIMLVVTVALLAILLVVLVKFKQTTGLTS